MYHNQQKPHSYHQRRRSRTIAWTGVGHTAVGKDENVPKNNAGRQQQHPVVVLNGKIQSVQGSQTVIDSQIHLGGEQIPLPQVTVGGPLMQVFHSISGWVILFRDAGCHVISDHGDTQHDLGNRNR